MKRHPQFVLLNIGLIILVLTAFACNNAALGSASNTNTGPTLTQPGSSTAPTIIPTTNPVIKVTNSGAWYSSAIASQTGTFTATLTASSATSNNDAVITLGAITPVSYADAACAIRFSTSGLVDIRNAGAYSAAAVFPYSAGDSYTIRITVNIPAKTYSVYIKPLTGSETTLASNYSFRTEQAGASSIAFYGARVNTTGTGDFSVSDCTISNSVPAATTPPPTSSPASSPDSVTQTAGMKDSSGNPLATHAPNTVSGTTRNVTMAPYNAVPNDGNDDRAAFEAAYSACAVGDELYIPNGTYDLKTTWSSDTATNLKLTKNQVNIRGQSKTGTIIKSYLDHTGSTSFYGIKAQGIHDVVISNLTITNAWDKAYSTNTSVANPNKGGLTYGIAIGASGSTYAYKITVSNVLVEKYTRMAFRVAAGAHDIVLKNCTAQHATDVAGGGAGYGYVLQGADHSAYPITQDPYPTNPYLGTTSDNYNNVVDGCATIGPYIRHAVIIQYWSHHNLVTNSSFDNCQLDAIDLHGEDEYANEISWNTISNGMRAGVGMGNSGAGHDLTGLYNWIHHNTIDNCQWGVNIEYGTLYTLIENNIIRNSTKTTTSTPGACAFGLGGSRGGVIRNNTISNNTASDYKLVHLYDSPAQTDPTNWISGECPASGPKNWVVSSNTASGSGTTVTNSASLGANNNIQTTW